MISNQEAFVQQLTQKQNSLFAYLLSLLGNVDEAHNMLQETNLVLWRKAETFEVGTDFGAWARKIAYYQVLAYLRDRKRDKHLFDADLMTQIAERPRSDTDDQERRLALRHCLSQLDDAQRQMINLRYHLQESVRTMAEQLAKSESAIKMTLMRIRRALLTCIQSKLQQTGQP